MTRIKYPCIPSGRIRKILLPSVNAQEPLKQSDWNNVIIPPDYQDEGSCVCHATCNWMEAMLRFYFGRDVLRPGEQLDAQKMYWSIREEIYHDQSDEGLQSQECFEFMIRHGILHPDSVVKEINPILSDMVKALQTTPLICPFLVGNNWDSSKVSSINGWVPYEEVNPWSALGGHEVCLIGTRIQEGVQCISFINSWQNWGWHSIGMMTMDSFNEWHRWMGDGPHTIANPELMLTFAESKWRDWVIVPKHQEVLV